MKKDSEVLGRQPIRSDLGCFPFRVVRVFRGPTVFSVLVIASCAIALATAAASPLADAVEKQDRAAIQSVMGDTDINTPQVDGMTALHWAAYHNDSDTAKLLLAAGANANAENRYGVTPEWRLDKAQNFFVQMFATICIRKPGTHDLTGEAVHFREDGFDAAVFGDGHFEPVGLLL